MAICTLGVISTIADSACGYAAMSLLPEGMDVLAIEFKINFLAPAKGDELVAMMPGSIIVKQRS